MSTTFTPEEIYNLVLEDNGVTPLGDLAKTFGFRDGRGLKTAVVEHILAQQMENNYLQFPKLNIETPKSKKISNEMLVTRKDKTKKVWINVDRLENLGMGNVSTFVSSVVEGNLVLTPINFFEAVETVETDNLVTV